MSRSNITQIVYSQEYLICYILERDILLLYEYIITYAHNYINIYNYIYIYYYYI